MKKFFVGALFLLLTINIQAQWYNIRYGVSNITDLSESQLKKALQNAEESIKIGKTFTFIGIGSTLLGGILVVDGLSSMNDFWESFWNGWGEAGGGTLIMNAGSGMMLLGTPFWIISANRRNSIEVALTKFNSSSFLDYSQHIFGGNAQPSTLGLRLKIFFSKTLNINKLRCRYNIVSKKSKIQQKTCYEARFYCNFCS